MSRASLLPALGRGGALLVLASGCSDVDATCSSQDLYDPNADTALVAGAAVTGDVMLSTDETSFSTAFITVLAGLPEVWVGEEPLRHPTLSVAFELSYADSQPAGAELPPVTATLDSGRAAVAPWEPAQATVTLGGAGGATGTLGVAPFVMCSSGSTQDCCAYGAASCSGGAALRLSREADIFPTVRIRYTAKPSANLYSCLEDEHAARWTLEETGQ